MLIVTVEKMGPLRGDGKFYASYKSFFLFVEKMGPLRGDGKSLCATSTKYFFT